MSDGEQQERQDFGIDFGEVRHEPKQSRRALKLYVAVLVLFPFALIIGTLLWMSTDGYSLRSPYPSVALSGYGMNARGKDCQVLVTGDSTALVGVVPKVIEDRTGLKTCNISEVASVQMVNGTMMPDTYLQHNRRPKYIVFFYAPENLTSPSDQRFVSLFEGLLFRVRFHPDAGLLRLMLSNPSDVVTGVELGFRTGIEELFSRRIDKVRSHLRDSNDGWLPMPAPSLADCAGVPRMRAPDAVWLQSIRHKYEVSGTTVLIDVAPEPPCDPTLGYYRALLKPGMVDNELSILPLAVFNNSGHLHTNPDGAEMISARVADQIAQLEERSGR